MQNLREVNETIQIMRTLQPGFPSCTAIPNDTYKIVLDVKNCIYTISLESQDCQQFIFSTPSVNFKEPMRRKILLKHLVSRYDKQCYIMPEICGSGYIKCQSSISTSLYYLLYG